MFFMKLFLKNGCTFYNRCILFPTAAICGDMVHHLTETTGELSSPKDAESALECDWLIKPREYYSRKCTIPAFFKSVAIGPGSDYFILPNKKVFKRLFGMSSIIVQWQISSNIFLSKQAKMSLVFMKLLLVKSVYTRFMQLEGRGLDL